MTATATAPAFQTVTRVDVRVVVNGDYLIVGVATLVDPEFDVWAADDAIGNMRIGEFCTQDAAVAEIQEYASTRYAHILTGNSDDEDYETGE